jgi:CDP-glycerol glycerophosphotransferase (TagB/SpsB family)
LIYLGEQDNLAINIQELLLITDILITDYSSVLFDFVLLDKPSICFAYDYEYYRDIDSGLYYEIEDYSAGRVTRSFEETCEELEQLLNGVDNYIHKRRYVREKYMPYDDGNACAKIFIAVFKNSTQESNR